MAWLAAVYLKHLCGFYLTRGYLSANSIVNRPCPNRRFILCHRAADQSNRIKNNEIARISLTKYTYTYIYIYIYRQENGEWNEILLAVSEGKIPRNNNLNVSNILPHPSPELYRRRSSESSSSPLDESSNSRDDSPCNGI